MTQLTNPAAIFMAIPKYRIDNIIGIHTGSFGISAPTSSSGPITATQSFTTGFSDTCLFQGIFSTDSGATWNDFGANKPNLTTPGDPVLDTVTCQGWVTPTGVFTAQGLNFFDFTHNVGTAYTIQYKVVFFAKDNQRAITPLPTNEILKYNSGFNYQKIYLSGTFTNNTGSSTTIAHNLGYVPKVRAWFISTTLSVANSLFSYDWAGQGGYNITVDNSNATFDAIVGDGATTVIYRIYLDK